MDLVRNFPLFPLGLVALPSEVVPLHIFEERYKTMIDRCLDEESEFGIVWMAEDGLRPIGCACEIAEVIVRLEDGRIINLTTRTTETGGREMGVLEQLFGNLLNLDAEQFQDQ